MERQEILFERDSQPIFVRERRYRARSFVRCAMHRDAISVASCEGQCALRTLEKLPRIDRMPRKYGYSDRWIGPYRRTLDFDSLLEHRKNTGGPEKCNGLRRQRM